MTKGKICSQTAHAVLGVYKDLSGDPEEPVAGDLEKAGDPELLALWASLQYPKVTLTAKSIEELYSLEQMADKDGIYSCCVHDAGRTQVAPMTPTVCAVGPCEWSKVKGLVMKGQHQILN